MSDVFWHSQLALDVSFGHLGKDIVAPKQRNPRVVLNSEGGSVLRTLREELKGSSSFTFSVAFVSPRAIALLKQELVDFTGTGHVITSDYLSFNSPAAFAELHNLRRLGIDVRIHRASAFHPKGYVFEHADAVTAMIGSSNLTEAALVNNHEWNLRVSAAPDSDLAAQLSTLVAQQLVDSEPLTQEWIERYAESYLAPAPRPGKGPHQPPWIDQSDSGNTFDSQVVPNQMQRDALLEIDLIRANGQRRAIVISATGTGKTMLSALDVRAAAPWRLLFVVHREQIVDRTIQEFRQVLGGEPSDFGKLTGTVKELNSRYLFATVQTLSQPETLQQFAPHHFDYIIVDEAHRVGAASHQRILSYFQPKFLLGMTATPERTDGFNVFQLFDYNVPYEIRLQHALDEGMLSPFHYYGVADIRSAGGRTTSADAGLDDLVSTERVNHIIRTIEIYGQASSAPCGLIFCSRKDEAYALSTALNRCTMRDQPLRTVALTGDDPIELRETRVAELETGQLDYILTVDIFNEGVDIPSVNQVIMLRQTQSAIVFVQQLGRGLRRSANKEYLVVIDFIGNYSNNYLIPTALFGDESLNKESLRKNLIAAEEIGVLAGLSSVRFDRISQERVLRSITSTTLDNMREVGRAIVAMHNRVGAVPELWDFLRFESVDPVLLATKRENYPALIKSVLHVDTGLSSDEHKALALISHEVLTAKRPHELILLELLLSQGSATTAQIGQAFRATGIPSTSSHVESTIDTFTLERHAEADRKRYGRAVVVWPEPHTVRLSPEFLASYASSPNFTSAIDDLIHTGRRLVKNRYDVAVPFTPGRQYSRKEVTRLLCWPRKWTSTLYGYRVNKITGTCPIFVTLHKAEHVSASTAYEDALLDRSNLRWYTRSRRTLQSPEVRAIVDREVVVHVFVKKDDAEGADFYYLGEAVAHDARQAAMPDDDGSHLDVVVMRLAFERPIDTALYDYFHPSLTL